MAGAESGMRVAGEVRIRDIVASLAELSSRLFQEKVWATPSLEWESSYVECITRLFEESRLHDALEEGQVFGAEVDAMLRELDRLTDEIDHRRPDREVMEDPKFAVCVRIAADALPFVILRSELAP